MEHQHMPAEGKLKNGDLLLVLRLVGRVLHIQAVITRFWQVSDSSLPGGDGNSMIRQESTRQKLTRISHYPGHRIKPTQKKMDDSERTWDDSAGDDSVCRQDPVYSKPGAA